MHYFKSFLYFSLVFFLIVSAEAQENGFRVGFGVGISRDLYFGNLGEGNPIFALPIDFANFTFLIRGANFRFEPSLGFFSHSQSVSHDGDEFTSSISNWRLGATITSENSIDHVNLYYGINIGIILTYVSDDLSYPGPEPGNNDENKTDFFIGPAIGGEYMFSDNFSLGGEIQINYISVGRFDDSSEYDITEYMISSRGMIVLRWYVN